MKRSRIALLVSVFALVSATAEARTIPITSGVFTAFGVSGGASGTFSGDGFSFTGAGSAGGGVNPFCFPCRPGETLFLRTTYSGSDLNGSGTIDGVPRLFGSLDNGRVSLLIEFAGDNRVLPPQQSADVTLEAPFSFTGHATFPFHGG